MKLHCQDITLSYAEAETPVFAHLSFAIEGPGFHALFGPSGVGKTTLARLLIGQIQPAAGRILSAPGRRHLYTYNLERLPGWSSVGHHLDKVTPPARRPTRDDLVAQFGLENVLGQRFAQLSMGQKNRINLVRYLVQDFDMLIMDESLANVDEPTRERILLKIKALFPQRFFLYISHNVVEVARFCRQVLVLRGAHRQPQAVVLPAGDQGGGRDPSSRDLQQTMLAMMNAG